MLEDHVLFLILWAASGILALVGGVVVIRKAAREMERPAEQSSRDKPEDVLVA